MYGLTDVSIPEGIIRIGSYAFYGCEGLTSFDVPESVKIIDNGAFSNCTGLTEFTVPKNVENMGVGMLTDCSSLVKLTIPYAAMSKDTIEDDIEGNENSPKNIFELYYSKVPELLDTIVITGGNSIPEGAFSDISGLKEVVLPETIETIKADAFRGCTNLDVINFPESLKQIGQDAFCTTKWLADQADGIVYAGKTAYTYKGNMESSALLVDKNLI